MMAQLIADTLVMAIGGAASLRPCRITRIEAVCTSVSRSKLLAYQGFACNLSRSGDCWDNAAIESFFSSLKTERTACIRCYTGDQAKADVFDYVECFYNPRRRHSPLGDLSLMGSYGRQSEQRLVSIKAAAGHGLPHFDVAAWERYGTKETIVAVILRTFVRCSF